MIFPNKIILSALIFCSAALIAPSLNASVISMNVTVTAQVSGNTLRCSVKAINHGDEDARDVQVEADVLGEVLKGEKVPSLAPKEMCSSEFDFPLAIQVPGKYPVVVTVRFSDANGHPFSSITCSDFSWKEDTSSGLFGEIKNVRILNKSSLRLMLSNMDEKKHDLKIRIIAPREFTVRPSAKQFVIEGRHRAGLGFTMDNFAALPGSRSPVFAACEYEEEGRHYLVILNGMIDVVAEPVLGKFGEPPLFVLLIVTIGAVIVLQFRRLLRRNSP